MRLTAMVPAALLLLTSAPALARLSAAFFSLSGANHEFVHSSLILAPGSIALVPSGFAIEVPPGFEMQVRPRSGLAAKHDGSGST